MIIKLTKKSGEVVMLDEQGPVAIHHAPGVHTHLQGLTPVLHARMWVCTSASIARIDIEAE